MESDEIIDVTDAQEEVAKDVPALYSPRAILGFTAFFSTIFGAVLLVMNLKKAKQKLIVIGFGLIYTLAAVAILDTIPQRSFITISINVVGGYVLSYFFWNKYIGKSTPFVAKPIWKPLIICLLITVPIVVLIVLHII